MKTIPKIYEPSSEPQIYSGVPTFMGLPAAKKEELSQYDFAVMGVPWEGACTIGGFSSCELAPKAIRQASVRYMGYLPEWNIDIFDYMSLCDYGDSPTRNGDYEFTFNALKERYAHMLDAGNIPIMFGGDHGISYPVIQTIAKRHPKKVGVIHFDAHLDNFNAFGDDELGRCSPFYRLYNDENMDPTKIVHLGIRGPRNHPKEGANARKFGATVITAKKVKDMGYREAIKMALEIAKKDTEFLYITICSDILEGADNPDGPIDPCGLSTFEIAMMLNECGAAGANAFDYVEIYPSSDGPQIGPHTANFFAIYFMNGIVRGRLGIGFDEEKE